ncbi:MAG: heavy-metal-associated domain-containing protein, partial [Patescibacteria group bacterium]
MQKTKFKIKGMHCNSCALLIEEKLKNMRGLIKAKISYDSGMGVIMYDENTIQETQIQGEIEKAGNYQIEKIKEESEEKSEEKLKREESQPIVDHKNTLTSSSPKMMFSLGFLV